MRKVLGQSVKRIAAKLMLGIFSLMGVANINLGQAAQVVTDPTAYEHLVSHAGWLEKVGNQTLRMQEKIHSVNEGIGTSLGIITSYTELARMGLLIAGRCEDPFSGLESFFLGLKKFNMGEFDFCSLAASRATYDALLFIPHGQREAPTDRQMETLSRERQQMIRESVSSTLSVTSLQKKEVMERRGVINERMRESMSSKSLREDMRHNNILLSVIAQELTNIRILLIQQSEVQAATAAEQVRFHVR